MARVPGPRYMSGTEPDVMRTTGYALGRSRMGQRARAARGQTERQVRKTRLSDAEKRFLLAEAAYEGSPYHKRNPGDFGLTPPSLPRADKTLCDDARVFERAKAVELFERAIQNGIVSVATKDGGFPGQMWVVDDHGRVFELIYGGSKAGRYHGYPVRDVDPLSERIRAIWGDR